MSSLNICVTLPQYTSRAPPHTSRGELLNNSARTRARIQLTLGRFYWIKQNILWQTWIKVRVGNQYPVGTATVQYLLYFYLFYKIFYRYYTTKQFASTNLDLVYICLSLNLIVVKLSFKAKYVCLLAYPTHFCQYCPFTQSALTFDVINHSSRYGYIMKKYIIIFITGLLRVIFK
jgi:hypothetical protein